MGASHGAEIVPDTVTLPIATGFVKENAGRRVREPGVYLGAGALPLAGARSIGERPLVTR